MRVLFVCTGNLCRSPMAEAILRHVLAQRAGVKPGELEAKGFTIESAGTHAWKGLPPPEGTVRAMQELGCEVDRHRSKPLTAEMLGAADVIYGMAREHVDWIRTWQPELARHTVPFDPTGDVRDPMGGSAEEFRACAKHIHDIVERIVRKL